MKIDKKVIAAYWENGWVVIEDVFEHRVVEEVARLAVELVEMMPTARGPEPRKIDQPFLKHETFRKLATDTALRDILRQVLGGIEPLLATDQIFMKPPRQGSAKPYHQDNAYFLCEPADHTITAWIALDDATEANGCLRYINGSHRNPILPHEPLPDEPYNLEPDRKLIDLSRERAAVVRKGGIVLHHAAALHSSHANRSEHWRRGYASHWVTADVITKSNVLDRPYFRTEYWRELTGLDVPTNAAR